MAEKRTGIVIASKTELKSLYILDVPTGALVELYEIDKYDTPYGKGSKMRYKYEDLDYVIPTKWVQ